jgi:hypothetical protein
VIAKDLQADPSDHHTKIYYFGFIQRPIVLLFEQGAHGNGGPGQWDDTPWKKSLQTLFVD